MAGNKNSGVSIPFRLSEAQLEKKIVQFREMYGDGSKGIVTWALFCMFLGYSEEEVRECYLKGREGKNAYSGRADLLEKFHTECKALTCQTANKQQALVRCNNLNFTFQVTYGILKEKAKGVYHNVKQRDLFNRRRTASS